MNKIWWIASMAGMALISLGTVAGNKPNVPADVRIEPSTGDPTGHKNESIFSPHQQLSAAVYQMALRGYQKLSRSKKLTRELLTIVDFSKPSTEKRLFVIDVAQQKVLIHTLVAHGQNSGENMATRFSNNDASHQSSLGFFITGNTYTGSNGYSMKLRGMEPGFNDRAEQRAIVMHGAPYVNTSIINNIGRLGRSWGCPAVSQQEHKEIIDLIKGGTCLFIYAPEAKYLASSTMIADKETGLN
ncbi:MAG TPA: murein L,D-transpeptidase catalytic domain family protein [Phnomibacter sp.]|nr:murein L,D-transpeptidase catalytic domain family protein [Phnomibacter sp.]